MLISQQVAAKMQKYIRSAHIDNTNTVDKATADDEQHLMSMVQSTVAKHFATQLKPVRPVKPPLANSYSPPANWKAAIEQLNKRMNKST